VGIVERGLAQRSFLLFPDKGRQGFTGALTDPDEIGFDGIDGITGRGFGSFFR
jgi:hypothetical protein